MTEIFTVPAASYASAYGSRHLGTWAAVLALPLLASIIAGFFDIRWWFVGLMLLLIVCPMAVAMAWISLIGRPSMALRLRPQQWTFNDDGKIHVDFFHFDRSEHPEAIASENVCIASVSPGSRYTTVRLQPGARFDLLLIPAAMLPAAILNTFSE